MHHYDRYAEELANDEANHVADLRALLGSAALPCPKLDIGPAFAAAAVAATGLQLAKDMPFSPYANDLFFLHGKPRILCRFLLLCLLSLSICLFLSG